MADPTPEPTSAPEAKQAKWTPPPIHRPIKNETARNYQKPVLAKLGLARHD